MFPFIRNAGNNNNNNHNKKRFTPLSLQKQP